MRKQRRSLRYDLSGRQTTSVVCRDFNTSFGLLHYLTFGVMLLDQHYMSALSQQDSSKTVSSGENRMPVGTVANPVLTQQLLDAFDQLQGVHPGFRPAHAKGLMCSGMFVPSAEAAKLTRAPHANRPSTPVTVRYSDSTGLPNIPDNDPARSGPRGIAIRFHLDEHLHTDIVAHSFDGFPVRTGEEFLELLRAVAAAGD